MTTRSIFGKRTAEVKQQEAGPEEIRHRTDSGATEPGSGCQIVELARENSSAETGKAQYFAFALRCFPEHGLRL